MKEKNDGRFNDPDLATPAHDAIMLWLNANAMAAIEQAFGIQAIFEQGKAAAEKEMSATAFPVVAKEDAKRLLAQPTPPVELKIKWEEPTRFAGGVRYIDMVIRGVASVPNTFITETMRGWDMELRACPPPFMEFTLCMHRLKFALACEVKPAIRSVGELIRQLRQYEHFGVSGELSKVAVVSPDDQFREIIESQGFVFIKAPAPQVGPQSGLF